MSLPSCHPADVATYVSALTFPVELRCIGTSQGTLSGYYDDSSALIRDVCRLSSRDDVPAVYVTLNPVTAELLARSYNTFTPYAKATTRDHDITRRVWLPIDLDPVRPSNVMATTQERETSVRKAETIRDRLASFGFPSPIMNDSGNGSHLLYAIDLPNDAETTELLKSFLNVLADVYDDAAAKVDRSVFNAARIWKVPGTMARKGDSVPALDRVHRLSRILQWPDSIGLLSPELIASATEALRLESPRKAPQKASQPLPTASVAIRSPADREAVEGASEWLRHALLDAGIVCHPKPYSEGSKWERIDCPFCNQHDGKGYLILSGDGCLTYTCAHANSCEYNSSGKPAGERTRDFLTHYHLQEGWNRVRPSASTRQPSGVERPVIQTTGRGLDDKVNDAIASIKALNGTDPKYFTTGPIVQLDAATGSVHSLSDGGLLDLLSQSATWVRATKGGTTPVDPPEKVVQVLRSRTSIQGIPQLAGVHDCPTFDKNGRLLDTPGYDPDSGLYLLPSVADFPPIASVPTANDVEQTKNLLMGELLGDFNFESESDRSHMMALLLLPYVRPMIEGPTPMHLIDAPKQGTGKGLLAEVFARIGTGRELAATNPPTNPDEWGKALLSSLMTAPPYVCYDNLDVAVKSSSLMSALTEAVYDGRILGKSENIKVPVRTIWVATGNNVRGTPDFARRCVRIRIDSNSEHPHLRSGFRHPDLSRWCREHRKELVVACLTLIRAWTSAGRPSPGNIPAKGRYESWSEVIGGILSHAGIPGFLLNEKEMLEAVNTSDGEWGSVFTAWYGSPDLQGEVTTSELVACLYARGILDPIIGETRANPAISLGMKLHKREGQIFAGLKLVKGRDTIRNVTVWSLVPVEQVRQKITVQKPPVAPVIQHVSPVAQPELPMTECPVNVRDEQEIRSGGGT